MQSLIISGGHLDDDFAVSYMKQYEFALTIAVDAGIEFFDRMGWVPDYLVGDFDTVKPEILQKFLQLGGAKPKILQFQPEKDETDTELAIRTAMDQGCETIHILGATGSRMDHVLGNIHLLGMGIGRGVEIILVDPNNRIRMIEKGIVIKQEEQYGSYVSLLPFTPKVTKLTLTGFKYPLYHHTLECYHSLGVSNEIIAEQAEISFQDGVLLVVEAKD